jgi:hypothetical protein
VLDKKIEFDITTANAPRMKEGTSRFIESCLNMTGVKKKAIEWNVTPFRSYYFSDYLAKKEHWEDRWADGWMVNVIVDSRVEDFTNSCVPLPIKIDEEDETWDYNYQDPNHDRNALMISVFNESDTNVDSTRDLILKEINRRVSKDRVGIDISTRALDDKYYQLRVLLQGVQFPNWIEVGDHLLGYIKELKGIVNYRDLI